MSLPPGVRLGAYEIVSKLGAGGMGEVYLAHDPRLGRDVAVKVLPGAKEHDPDRLVRFEQEARAVAALDHPNIVTVYDVGVHDGGPFIVMEYVRGETLSASLRRERPSLARGLEIGSQIASALGAAHGRGILHRDLKPSNVMLTATGGVKVLDFGLAKTFVADTAETTETPLLPAVSTIPGIAVGTPAYMSPEQLLVLPLDNRTDIFSLGVILFELVTGQRPFKGDRLNAPAHSALTAPVLSASDADPTVPADVSGLIARMLARDPDDRPRSAGALVDELQALREKVAAAAPPPRRRARTAAVVLGAAALVAAATISLPRWLPPAPNTAAERPVIAVLPLTNLSSDLSKAYLGVGIADTLTTSLGRLSSISVVSRAAMQESGEPNTTNLAAIARELGATMLVQGSIQQSGDRVRVNATLVTPEGRVVWSGDSEASASELFALQNRLAASLIDALRITVTREERQQLARPPTADRAALDAYWRGVAMQDRPDYEDLDKAISSFQLAISRDPTFSLAHASLGDAYRRKATRTNDTGLMASAVEEVSEALRIDADQPEVRLALAGVYRSTGRNGAAVDELRRVLAKQPTNDDAHRELGNLLAREGQPNEALAELQRAVDLRPGYWRNHRALAMFHLQTGSTNEAVASFTRLTELKPDDAEPYQQLGAAYQMLGDQNRARQNYERAIGLSPSPSSYTNLGTIHYSEGRFDDAVSSYQKAIELAPNRALIRRNLGDAYVKLGRRADARAAYDKAVQLAEAALTLNPNDATTMSQLGVYEAKLGRRRDADRHTRGAIAINPESPDARYRRAVVLALNGEAEAALTELSEAFARGYAKRLALEDDDLATLRSRPSFQALVRTAQ